MPVPIRLFASLALLLTALALPAAESSAQYELMPDTSTLARELNRDRQRKPSAASTE